MIAALEQEDTAKLIRIVDEIDVPDVSVKIVPNFLNMITGLNQTNQIFGLPLIEVMPDPMPSWEKFTKRTFDIILSLCILVVTAPLFLVLIVLIKNNLARSGRFQSGKAWVVWQTVYHLQIQNHV